MEVRRATPPPHRQSQVSTGSSITEASKQVLPAQPMSPKALHQQKFIAEFIIAQDEQNAAQKSFRLKKAISYTVSFASQVQELHKLQESRFDECINNYIDHINTISKCGTQAQRDIAIDTLLTTCKYIHRAHAVPILAKYFTMPKAKGILQYFIETVQQSSDANRLQLELTVLISKQYLYNARTMISRLLESEGQYKHAVNKHNQHSSFNLFNMFFSSGMSIDTAVTQIECIVDVLHTLVQLLKNITDKGVADTDTLEILYVTSGLCVNLDLFVNKVFNVTNLRGNELRHKISSIKVNILMAERVGLRKNEIIANTTTHTSVTASTHRVEPPQPQSISSVTRSSVTVQQSSVRNNQTGEITIKRSVIATEATTIKLGDGNSHADTGFQQTYSSLNSNVAIGQETHSSVHHSGNKPPQLSINGNEDGLVDVNPDSRKGSCSSSHTNSINAPYLGNLYAEIPAVDVHVKDNN